MKEVQVVPRIYSFQYEDKYLMAHGFALLDSHYTNNRAQATRHYWRHDIGDVFLRFVDYDGRNDLQIHTFVGEKEVKFDVVVDKIEGSLEQEDIKEEL